jgi:hypothetical protein
MSYGSRAIKKGKAPVEQRTTEIVRAIDPGRQVQRKSDRRSRGVVFVISSIEIFEIKGGANSRNARSRYFMWNKHEVMARGRMGR